MVDPTTAEDPPMTGRILNYPVRKYFLDLRPERKKRPSRVFSYLILNPGIKPNHRAIAFK